MENNFQDFLFHNSLDDDDPGQSESISWNNMFWPTPDFNPSSGNTFPLPLADHAHRYPMTIPQRIQEQQVSNKGISSTETLQGYTNDQTWLTGPNLPWLADPQSIVDNSSDLLPPVSQPLFPAQRPMTPPRSANAEQPSPSWGTNAQTVEQLTPAIGLNAFNSFDPAGLTANLTAPQTPREDAVGIAIRSGPSARFQDTNLLSYPVEPSSVALQHQRSVDDGRQPAGVTFNNNLESQKAFSEGYEDIFYQEGPNLFGLPGASPYHAAQDVNSAIAPENKLRPQGPLELSISSLEAEVPTLREFPTDSSDMDVDWSGRGPSVGLKPSQNARQKDRLLIEWKNKGLSYKEIRSRGQFEEAESTLRGRYRTLTKPKHLRVRRPEWKSKDVIPVLRP